MIRKALDSVKWLLRIFYSLHRTSWRNFRMSLILHPFSNKKHFSSFKSSADFYKDRLTDAEQDAIENPPTTPKPIKSKGSTPQRRRPSRPPKRVVVEEEEEEEEE